MCPETQPSIKIDGEHHANSTDNSSNFLNYFTKGSQFNIKYMPSFEYHASNHHSLYFPGSSLSSKNKFFSFRNDLEFRFQHKHILAQATFKINSGKKDNYYTSYFNQLYYENKFGNYNITLGKKVISWGVGHAFRPLDVIQQEDRTLVNAPTLSGVPLISVDRFTDSGALTFVWSNPYKFEDDTNREKSVAIRYFRFSDSYDFHLVGKYSKTKKGEFGLGGTYILNDNISLFASALYSRHYSKRLNRLIGTNNYYSADNPMYNKISSNAYRFDAGFQWTGDSGFGVLLEIFHDGEAYSESDWKRLNDLTKNQIRFSNFITQEILASNIAWSTTAFKNVNLISDNLLLRFSYDDSDGFKPYIDFMLASDGGLMSTVFFAYEKNRLRYSLGFRHYGGNRNSVFHNIPTSNVTWGRVEVSF